MSPRGIASEVRAELEFHIEMRALDNIRSGMDPRAARADARRRFGDLEATAARCRRARGRDDARGMFHLLGLTGLLVLVLAALQAIRTPTPSGASDTVILARLVAPTLLTLAVTVTGCCLSFSSLRRAR